MAAHKHSTAQVTNIRVSPLGGYTKYMSAAAFTNLRPINSRPHHHRIRHWENTSQRAHLGGSALLGAPSLRPLARLAAPSPVALPPIAQHIADRGLRDRRPRVDRSRPTLQPRGPREHDIQVQPPGQSNVIN